MEIFFEYFCTRYATLSDLTLTAKVQPVYNNRTRLTGGVFSIGLAVTLPLGDNPALVTCEQTSLKLYLNKCLKLGKFSPYPVINGKQQKKS